MKKILFIDDDTSLLETVGDFLEGEGYAVARAESAEKALALLQAGAKPNLVILDMMMPGIGGMGFLDRTVLPDGSFPFPVLVLTAKADMAEYFADKQVDGFLAKPCAPEDLSLEVSRIIFQAAGEQPPAPAAKPAVYVADPSPARGETLTAALVDAGYAAMAFPDAASLVQAAVVNPPAAVAASVLLHDLKATALVDLLRGMSATAAVKTVVYGIGLPGAPLETVLELDSRKCATASGDGAYDVTAAVNSAMLAR